VTVTTRLDLRKRRGLLVLVDRRARTRYSATEAGDALTLWLLAHGVDVPAEAVSLAEVIGCGRGAGLVITDLWYPRLGGGRACTILVTWAGRQPAGQVS
jgi:hypothetical protein